jgi:hypothetical protein
MSRLWRMAEEYVLEFDRVCRENGIRCAIHVIPAEIQVDPDIAAQVFDGLGLDPADYDLDLPQRRITDFCERHGIAVLDPLEYLRQSHRPDARLYIPNDTHWNARGNRLAGELLASFIDERLAPGGGRQGRASSGGELAAAGHTERLR